MSDNDNDIDGLLGYLSICADRYSCHTLPSDVAANYHAALTALVAEREKLVEDNASQTYKGNSVRYWHDKACAYKATIGGLWEILGSAAVHPDGERTITAALTALVAERNALRQRVEELEKTAFFIPPADRDRDRDRELRERLVESALRVAHDTMMTESEAEKLGRQTVWIVNGALAAMRKGGGA